MKRHVFPLVLGLASFGVCAGCAKSRSVTRANLDPPATERVPIDERNRTTPGSGLPTGTVASQSTSRAGDQSKIRLVAGQQDLPVPAASTESSAAPPDETKADVAPAVSAASITSGPMGLAELEDLAGRNNPTLVQAQAEIEVDRGFLKQAGLYPNPQVGYINESASNPSVKQSNGIFLSQEFVTAGKLSKAQESILQEIKQMEWDREAQRMRVMNDLKIRYYEVLGAQRALEIARNLVKVANETVAITERMLANEGTRSDVLQAQVQLETQLLALDDAEYRYRCAWEQLAVIIGVPSLPLTPLTGELAAELPILDKEACLQRLMSNSPQLAGVASQLDHGWAEYRSQCAQATPNVTVQAVVDYDKATQSTTASTLVAMPFPIYNRNQGNIDKATADIHLFQAEITRVQLVLTDQFADSYRRYLSSRRQAERLKDAIIPHSEKNLKLTRETYEGGLTNFSSVLSAQQTYFQSQMAYVEALTELNKIVVEIEGLQLTGGLNPPAIGSAIQAQPGGGAQRQRALLKDVQDKAQKQLLPAAQIAQ